jgi:hypothetical protein
MKKYLKIIYLNLFLLILTHFSLSQNNVLIKEGIILLNNKIDYKILSTVKLLENNKFFYGFLVIQIDSNSYIDSLKEGGEMFHTSIYWVEDIDSIDNEFSRYYYTLPISLISDGDRSYDNGKRDNLSIFLYFYNLFNYNNKEKEVSYLYPYTTKFITSDLLFDAMIWNKNSEDINYVIYECSFYTAVLYFEEFNKKALIPTSGLKSFSIINAVMLEKKGYFKSKLNILKVK